jgi:hypothetical protein
MLVFDVRPADRLHTNCCWLLLSLRTPRQLEAQLHYASGLIDGVCRARCTLLPRVLLEHDARRVFGILCLHAVSTAQAKITSGHEDAQSIHATASIQQPLMRACVQADWQLNWGCVVCCVSATHS